MAFGGVERNQELQDRSIYVDARTVEQRLADTLLKHDTFRNVLCASVLACFAVPVATVIIVPAALVMSGWWKGRIARFRLPIRFPEWTGHLDPSNIDDNRGICKAEGIEFLGVERAGRTSDRTFEAWASDSDVRTHRVIMGTTGAGKAQPNDAKVMTDRGWKRMGDIEVGDRVAVPDGGFATVLAVYPQGRINVNQITFIDGRQTSACDNHLWEVHHKHWIGKYKKGTSRAGSAKPRVLTTSEIKSQIERNKGAFYIPLPSAVDLPEKALAIHPYLMGVFLGDGCTRRSGAIITSADEEIISAIRPHLDSMGLELHQYAGHKRKYDYFIRQKREFFKQGRGILNPFNVALKDAGLYDKKSFEKFVPPDYMESSAEQRRQLLRGLIDTDGTVDHHGCVSFTSTSRQLAIDCQALARSLGATAKMTCRTTQYTYKGEKKSGRESYTVRIRHPNPKEIVSLSRKSERISDDYQYGKNLQLQIKSIEPIGEKESTCIYIDHPRHLYITDDYVVTHNTESLLSILFNPLCWGSGFSMTDGKAQIDVTARVFVMSWMFWREDDVLILNYMRGGQDRFYEMINKPKVGIRKTRVSNTWNPFSTANHETINQIIDSIMEKASGDGAQWQAKAINMKNALVQTIAYLRAKGDMLMSVSAIREQMALDNMIKLAMRNDIPPAAAAAIRSYLSSGLPGFSWAKAKGGKPQDPDTLLQHGYLTGQFTRTLGLMTDTYFDIFGDEIPEFDTSDVILNNRISFTMIPTLEKGVEEAGNLGKMQVASAKMMMSENLGYEVEGNYDDVVDNRQTNTHRPFYLVMDELGYYFAPGIDLMFAQGRSLQIALIAAGQDFQAMAKNNKNEVESMIANTRIKVSYKLEDPKETYEIFQKAGGKAAVAKISGYEVADAGMGTPVGQYNRLKNASIEETDRISLQELKKLGPGDGVMLYSDKVIRFKSFNLFMKYKFDKKKVNIRINTFLPIAMPDFGQIMSKSKPVVTSREAVGARLLSVLRGGDITWTAEAEKMVRNDPVLNAMRYASDRITDEPNMTPQDKGIVLFMSAIRAMEESEKKTQEPTSKPREEKGLIKNAGMPSAPATTGSELNFLNDPPLVERMAVAMPDWGDDENVTFGDNESHSESEKETAKEEIDFSESTKSEIQKSIIALAGGPLSITEETVQEEIERTRKLVDSSCRFKEAGRGADAPPMAVSDADDVLSMLDSLSRDLAG